MVKAKPAHNKSIHKGARSDKAQPPENSSQHDNQGKSGLSNELIGLDGQGFAA